MKAVVVDYTNGEKEQYHQPIVPGKKIKNGRQ